MTQKHTAFKHTPLPFWKWTHTGVVYKIDEEAKTATIVHGTSRFKCEQVGVVKNLCDLKKPWSDEGKAMKQYATLEKAKGE